MLPLMFGLLVLTATLSTQQTDLSSRPEERSLDATVADFAANATMWQKQQECLEFCRGQCDNGQCKCSQPFCGQFCNRQCQHGGTCNVGPNRCLCTMGWAGEFCEVQEPGFAPDDSPSGKPANPVHHDKIVMVRLIRFPCCCFFVCLDRFENLKKKMVQKSRIQVMVFCVLQFPPGTNY